MARSPLPLRQRCSIPRGRGHARAVTAPAAQIGIGPRRPCRRDLHFGQALEQVVVLLGWRFRSKRGHMPRAADHGDTLEAFLFRLPQRFAHVALPAASPVRRVRVWALRPAARSWLHGWRRTALGRRCAPRPCGSTTPRRRRIRRRVRASRADRRKRPPEQTPHPRRFRPYRPYRRLQAVRGQAYSWRCFQVPRA